MLVDLYAAPYTAAALITTTVLALLYGRERTKAKGPRARNVRLPGGEKCVVSGVSLGGPRLHPKPRISRRPAGALF